MHRFAAKFVPHLMTEQQKENQMVVCLQHLVHDDKIVAQKTVTGDEAKDLYPQK